MNNYPIFDNEYIKPENSLIMHNFGKYLNFTDNLVNTIQFSSINKIEIPLTFYPIAKNIRTTSSYMARNILNGNSSYIHNLDRMGEAGFWRDFKKMGDWFPWLWARGRISESFTNIEGWKYYFNSFTSNATQLIVNNNDQEYINPPDNLKLFFTYISCIKYAFQLNNIYNDQMQTYKTQMYWPDSANVLAVQIRRGETCTKDGSMTDRPFYHLDKYVEKIELLLQNNNYEYIYVSTDSDEEIGELKRMRPDWNLLYLPIDRTQFFRMQEKPVDLEVFCTLEPDRIPFIVDSALADLYFISQCQGYISTISVSEFSRCGWFLQLAVQGRLTPYINMNDELLDMTKRDKLLLL